MHNFWMIFKDEYKKRTGKRSFLIMTIGLPLMIALLMGVIITVAEKSAGEKPIGYVDQSGLIHGEVTLPRDQEDYSVEIKPYASEADAKNALAAGQIQSFYVIPSNYLQAKEINRYDWQRGPSTVAQSQFSHFLRASLAAALPPEAQSLILEPPELVVRAMDGSREISNGNVTSILIPFIAGFLFFFSTVTSASYLLQVVADEKENRTMEILMTSISPEQFISGKALSLMSVSLTQLGVWILVIATGVFIARPYAPELQSINIPLDYLLVGILFFLPAFALIAGLMIAIGSAVTETRQGQQISGVLNLLFIFPFFFSVLVFTAPNSPLMVILTLFPTTSFITVSMRWGVTAIPLVQLILSWLLLVLSATASVWAATRIFRLGMLRYGQRLSLRSAIQGLRTGKESQA
jgi:ABC-2 type transport system permease protein